LLRDASLDTNVVTQNKQNKIRTAALILTFFFSIFLSSVLSFLSFVSAARTFFFSSKFFFEQQELCFVLSFFLFFQQQHKDLVHKILEQNDRQIYRIFRTVPSINMGQSFKWQ
jgi:hypothetical protein